MQKHNVRLTSLNCFNCSQARKENIGLRPHFSFNGSTFSSVPAGTAPVTLSFAAAQMDFMNQSYTVLKDSVYNALVLQTRLKPVLDQVTLVEVAANDDELRMAA